MININKLKAALHEAELYGIGATSDTNQKIILEAAKSITAPVSEAVALKKTYIKPLRTIVEIDARYADKIRDLLNTTPPAASVFDTTIPGSEDMDKRFAWLEAKAIDMGYMLVPEPEHPDSPHATSPAASVGVEEIARLRNGLFGYVATFHEYDDGRPPLPIGFRKPTAEEIEERFSLLTRGPNPDVK